MVIPVKSVLINTYLLGPRETVFCDPKTSLRITKYTAFPRAQKIILFIYLHV